MLSVGVYDAIAHFHNDEKVALDIMELLKIDTGYYIIKCCRSVNLCRKRSSIYMMSAPQKKRQKVLRHSKKKATRQKKKMKLKEPHMKRRAFKIQY